MTGEELTKLLEPLIEGMGYEIADLELKVGGPDGFLRVFIDRQPEGIGLEDCEAVSRQISAVLDVEDPITEHYRLEVSSPGLDRRLRKVEHYQRFMGEEIRIKLRFPLDGRRNFRGQLKAVSDKNVEIEVDGTSHSLLLATIESARLVPTQ